MHALPALSGTDDCRTGTGGTAFLDAAAPSSPDTAISTCKQGSLVNGILSTASAAHSSSVYA